MSSGGLFSLFYGTVQWGDIIYEEKIMIPNEVAHAKSKNAGCGAATWLICSESMYIKHTCVEKLQHDWFIFANQLIRNLAHLK